MIQTCHIEAQQYGLRVLKELCFQMNSLLEQMYDLGDTLLVESAKEAVTKKKNCKPCKKTLKKAKKK